MNLESKALTQLKFQRSDWHTIHMDMCQILVKRSSCLRIQTACIITKNNIIISVGYNGTVSGSQHCSYYWIDKYYDDPTLQEMYETFDDFRQSDQFYHEHHEWSSINELHGEENAILHAGLNCVSVSGATLYTIYSPCSSCSKAIIQSRIKEVYYQKVYKRDTRGIEFLQKNGITCIQI